MCYLCSFYFMITDIIRIVHQAKSCQDITEVIQERKPEISFAPTFPWSNKHFVPLRLCVQLVMIIIEILPPMILLCSFALPPMIL